jgi:hypothetical protein
MLLDETLTQTSCPPQQPHEAQNVPAASALFFFLKTEEKSASREHFYMHFDKRSSTGFLLKRTRRGVA